MIFVNKDELKMNGSIVTILSDTTVILDEVYQLLREDFEEEKANELFALLGRVAVATEEEFEQILKEQWDELLSGM